MEIRGKVKSLGIWWMASVLAVATLAAEGDLRLVEAAKNSDREAVRSLLQQQVDVNTPQPDGATALAWAAHWNDLETADLLLRAGADVNAANDYGMTPLSLACSKGSAAMVEKLLQAGADPNAAQWTGVTPLMACARAGSADAVKSLLARHADVNAKDTRRGQTGLMWAVAQQHVEVVRLLIEQGADVNAKSHMPGGFTPLQFLTYGVRRRDPSGPDKLEPGDVHPDPSSSRGGFTALMFAARQGDVNSARLLVDAGANVNAVSPDYGSALVVAASSGHELAALFLLEKGADPNGADIWGFAPLHYALADGITAIGMSRKRIPTDRYWLRSNMPELVNSLLEQGANPNARVGKGFPPFNYPAFVRTTGNSMPQIRQPGATPFLLAAASFDARLMRLLHSHGADPLLTTDEGTTPLMVAAGMGRLDDLTEEEKKMALEAVNLAVELGGDVNAANANAAYVNTAYINASNQDGRTALAAAAYLGVNSIIQFLADQGADLEATDRYGQTALSIAQGIPPKIKGNDKRFRRGRPRKDTAALLLKLGATPQPAPATGY
ncbi:MAG: ankyrin repeat domain-containing protein [Acidobacteria bacterium]|nr:ankyrin repeat domain-containing protein [Acidobacteriota bacterium]